MDPQCYSTASRGPSHSYQRGTADAFAAPMSNTGAQCERDGLYLLSGACGHVSQRSLAKGETLPECGTCGCPVHFTLLREWGRQSSDETE